MDVKYELWGRVSHAIEERNRDALPWTDSARSRFERIPDFVRGQVLEAVEGNARTLGLSEVNDAVVDLVIDHWWRPATSTRGATGSDKHAALTKAASERCPQRGRSSSPRDRLCGCPRGRVGLTQVAPWRKSRFASIRQLGRPRGLAMGIHRPTHLLKALLIAGIATASLAGTSVVAHAYPPPKESHSIHCSPGSVSASGGTCTVTFTDKAKREGAGQTVCFDVKGPGTVKPACSNTNADGQATTIFTANSSGCGKEGSSSEDSGTKATIKGTEVETGDEAGNAQTTVKIRCPDEDNDTPAGSPQHTGSGSTTAIATSARNTGASVAPLTAGQVVPAAAILAVIVMLSAAITGRLRLGRLRR